MADARGGNPEVIARARAGDLAGAITAGEAAIAGGDTDPGLAMFVGMMCCRRGELARGIPFLERALAQAPEEAPPRIELARALLGVGRDDEARALAAGRATASTPVGRELLRIGAQADLRLGATEQAGDAFARLVAADPRDFESWDGLAAAQVRLGDASAAIVAAERATALQPGTARFLLTLSRARLAAGEFAAARDAAAQAVQRAPDDPAPHLELARAWLGDRHFHEAAAALDAASERAGADLGLLAAIGEAQAEARVLDRAETTFRRVLVADAAHADARIGLSRVLERTDRAAAALEVLGAAALPADRTAVIRGRALRTLGRLDDAVAVLAAAVRPEDVAAREQLLGEIADRQGDPPRAFAHFAAAAARVREASGGVTGPARAYLAKWDALSAVVSPGWRAGWRPREVPDDGRRDPVFIFGFPRSGTTLLDTLLGAHPDALVLEEEPVIDRLAEAFGAVERLGLIDTREIVRFRDLYFTAAETAAGPIGARLLIDKHPLGVGSLPILHRLFPAARYVFMLRHPLDVVLSCFMMSPDMNPHVADFTSLPETARLYGKVLGFWRRCVDQLPIAASEVRYESLVADRDASLRIVAAFAGLDWRDEMLSHRDAVKVRGQINSPSYSQVAEPIYDRASGRWRRYRAFLGDAAEVLAPWIERLGYELD